MRIANSITPIGTADQLTPTQRFLTSFSSNAAAASLGGIALEPCAQNWIGTQLSPLIPAKRWSPTMVEASAFLTAINASAVDANKFFVNFLASYYLAAAGSPVAAANLYTIIDFMAYIGRYLAILPLAVSSGALAAQQIPPQLVWNPATGEPIFNEFGTGYFFDTDFAANLPKTNGVPMFVGGGSGLFTTRHVNEILFGYKSGDFFVGQGAYLFSGGLQGPNSSIPTEDTVTSLPKHSVYTGADGDKTRITFWKKYYGMASITVVNDFYDSSPTPYNTRYCRTGSSQPSPRFSFADDCKVWNSEEMIKGLSDGFKAPYTFNEGGDAADMNVWVPEGWRHVPFQKTEDITFKDVKLWKYTMNPDALMNLTDANRLNDAGAITNAKNFFMTNHPSGVASRQRSDAMDLFVSFPHFYGADTQFFKNQIDIDINPDPLIHGSYLAVEPLTGRTFTGRKRLQVGAFLSQRKITDVKFNGIYSKLIANYTGNKGVDDNNIDTPTGSCKNNLYIPIFWAGEGKDIADDDASDFVTKIYGSRKTFLATQIALTIIGCVLFVVFLLLCIRAARTSAGTAV
jgi:hypothetical protein